MLRQREPSLDLPELRKLCHSAPHCFLRLPGICTYSPTECVHDDSLEGGRAFGRKSSDERTLPGCRECHLAYHANARGWQWEVEQGIKAWHRYLWANGWIGVKGKP